MKHVVMFSGGGGVSKYRNEPQVVDGHRFPSKREARRYEALRLLERAGEISDLQLQVTFPLHVNGRKVCSYIADFVYQEDGQQVVEDCKGFRTPEYRLKAKLMLAVHGIAIKET